MAASDHTVSRILRVIKRHIDGETARRIVRDLMEIPGNRSFRDTVEKMALKLKVSVEGGDGG